MRTGRIGGRCRRWERECSKMRGDSGIFSSQRCRDAEVFAEVSLSDFCLGREVRWEKSFYGKGEMV